MVAHAPLLTIGIPYFDDWARCHMAIQALRANNDLTDCELLLVDNNPDSDQGKLMAGWFPQFGRYVPYKDRIGTAPAKNAVFTNATGRFVLCIDSHVILPTYPENALARLIAWLRERPNCDDLLSGPILWDDLHTGATEFWPVWRGEMWGIWAGDPRQDPPEVRPVWGSGMGVFCARRESWLGFHPEFYGFGGEEGYLAEKYRHAGRQFLHLPFLDWWHSFNRGPIPIPFPNDDYHKCRNYVIGFQELGLDLAPVREHFIDEPVAGDESQVVMAGVAAGNRTEGARRLKPHHWERILADPIANRDPVPEKKCGSCGGGKAIPDEVTLEALYESAFKTPSDINEHCPKLRELASQCEHVTEFGMRRGVSTVSLLAGQPKRFVTYDLNRDKMADALKTRQGACEFEFRQGNSLTADIEETDLLFIDTRHTAEHVYQEITRHAPKVRRWMAFHDTVIFGERGEDGGPGLLPAMRRWMKENPEWSVIYHSQANNGLTVLSRRPEDKPKLPSLARMAWNLTKTMAAHVANGAKTATEEQANARLDICTTCEHRTEDRCSVCGCYVSAKASLDVSECPLGKWPE